MKPELRLGRKSRDRRSVPARGNCWQMHVIDLRGVRHESFIKTLNKIILINLFIDECKLLDDCKSTRAIDRIPLINTS